ncbi:MAG: MBL fold metallo-hydrolase [Spirochaetales bacterium]|nr:MBL fold metallo-hydrolase [Spirochaetales bacterium]
MKKQMKIMLCAVLISMPLIGAGALDKPNALRLSDELVISEIEKDVFLVTHSFPWPGNSLLVVLDRKNIVWIDTPYTPEATALVLDWALDRFGRDCRITEINTGFHIDNLGGNRELIKRKITVYGSSLTCELLKTRSAATMAKMAGWLNGPKNKKYKDAYTNFVFVPPTHTFDINREQKIRIGTNDVIVYFPGPTHTYDNLVVYIPDRKLLFGGCMILAADADKVGYAEDGNIGEWAKSMDNLEKRFASCRLVVPGHGNPGGPELIGHTRDVVKTAAGGNQ